jgi:transcription termination factor 2
MPSLKNSFGDFTLHAHQVTAVEWMMEREKDAEFSGGLLCDEMGLGKTLSVIGLIMNSRVKNTLVLGPLAVIPQWTRTLLRAKGPAVLEIVKGAWKMRGGNPALGRVYITNYDKLLAKPELFLLPIDRLICDEAHMVRNSGSKKYKALQKVAKEHTWLLTGTPIVNASNDLRNLVALGHKKINANTAATKERCDEWMKQYAMARTMEQIRDQLADLIPKTPVVLKHRLEFATKFEQTFYRGVQGCLVDQLQRLMVADNHNMRAFLLLLLRLRQISVHPQIYIAGRRATDETYTRPDWTIPSTKIQAIRDILRSESKSRGIVIFCHFKKEIELIQEALASEECVGKVLAYHGEMTAEQRTDTVMETEERMYEARKATDPTPKHTVLLAQIHCAGTGLNLQHMDRVIFTTPWWTAALMDQAAGRVLRLGQKEQVIIHHLSLQEEEETSINIDDFIHMRVEAKRALCQHLLSLAKNDIDSLKPTPLILDESVSVEDQDPVSYSTP